MNAIAEMKSAPFANSDFDIADAAYEQLDDTMPKNVALATVLGLWSPRRFRICSLETNAWTIPERVKPRMRAQSVSQNMKNASRRELPTSTKKDATATRPTQSA
jgi:hypothetical protein